MEQPTYVTKIQDKKYLIYGFIAGVVSFYAFHGYKGDNAGYLIVASVAIFIWYTSRKKQKGKTIYQVIREIAQMHKDETGEELDFLTAKAYWRGGNTYHIQFTNPTMAFSYNGPISKGVREITNRSAQSLKTEKDNLYVETKVWEVGEN